MGDVLLGLPALRGLRRAFPAAKITLVAPLPQARVALWEPAVDRVVGFDEPSVAHLVSGNAREWPEVLTIPELAVVWMRDHASVSANAERLRVARSVGCAPLEAIARRRHMSEWLGDSLASLGVATASGALVSPARVEAAGVVVHPGSGSVRKNWDGWTEVVGALRPERATVIAGPADEEPVKRLLGTWPAGVGAPALRAKLSLEQLGALLGGAALYLGNDSGVTHLAAAVGAPTVAVFGPTDPGVWAPVGPRVTTVGGSAVEQGIFSGTPRWPTVEQVVGAAEALCGQAA